MLMVRWGLYPMLVAGLVITFVLSRRVGWSLSTAYLAYSGARLVVLFGTELAFPARREWSMTRKSFVRDLKYIAVGGATMMGLRALVAVAAIDASRFNLGLLKGAPLWAELLSLVLLFEFFQYWLHRLSHEGRGWLGAFLWRVHVAHHLPNAVYLFMHGVMHPLNLVLIAAVNLPLVLLGASAEALFFFNALVSMQALVSHLNVDLRVGPLNYLLVGTELHRYHHSACTEEAQNYGAVTPVWDLVFGTFIYRPGRLPHQLGVEDSNKYPSSDDVLGVLGLWRAQRGQGQPGA